MIKDIKTIEQITSVLLGKIKSTLITMGEHCCRDYEKSINAEASLLMQHIEIYCLERKLIDVQGRE